MLGGRTPWDPAGSLLQGGGWLERMVRLLPQLCASLYLPWSRPFPPYPCLPPTGPPSFFSSFPLKIDLLYFLHKIQVHSKTVENTDISHEHSGPSPGTVHPPLRPLPRYRSPSMETPTQVPLTLHGDPHPRTTHPPWRPPPAFAHTFVTADEPTLLLLLLSRFSRVRLCATS